MNVWNNLYLQSQQHIIAQQAVANIQLNENLSEYAQVNTVTADWLPSPAKGILRILLERDGGEKTTRATSIVAYEPNSQFAPHTHPLGEEFFVLAGTFSDENGDYPAGTYVRNPPQSSHQPYSRNGCLILVKLQQFQADDRQRVVINTGVHSHEAGHNGWNCKVLFDGYERVELMAATDDTIFSGDIIKSIKGGVELLVLSGVLYDKDNQYQSGCWLRIPQKKMFTYHVKAGTQLWLKSNHLTGIG